MAVSSGMSFLLSATLVVLVFAGMQLYKSQLGANEWMTILGGGLGSVLFCLILTAINNLESYVFTKISKHNCFLKSLLVSMFASGLVHRVCVTTCFLFSMVHLYYINKLAQSYHAPAAPASVPVKVTKKKN